MGSAYRSGGKGSPNAPRRPARFGTRTRSERDRERFPAASVTVTFTVQVPAGSVTRWVPADSVFVTMRVRRCALSATVRRPGSSVVTLSVACAPWRSVTDGARVSRTGGGGGGGVATAASPPAWE